MRRIRVAREGIFGVLGWFVLIGIALALVWFSIIPLVGRLLAWWREGGPIVEPLVSFGLFLVNSLLIVLLGMVTLAVLQRLAGVRG